MSPSRFAAGSALLAALLAIGWSVPALAAKTPAATPARITDLPVVVNELPLVFDPMRFQGDWPMKWVPEEELFTEDMSRAERKAVQANRKDPNVKARPAAGPWKLFEGVVPESSCRSPQIGADGAVVMAVCSGFDVGRPGDEHVIVAREGRVLRYPEPVVRLEGGREAALADDGRRFAVVAGVGGRRAIHLVDLEKGTDLVIQGAWREPMQPSVDPEVDAVAFTAEVDGKSAAVVVDVAAKAAWSWSEAKEVHVRGLASKGRRMLVISRYSSIPQALVIDVEAKELYDLSEHKGSVDSARMLPSGVTVAFTAKVGGACAAYYHDFVRRNRTELVGTVDYCVENIVTEESQRLFLWEQFDTESRRTVLYDRKRRRLHWEMSTSCTNAVMSADGRLVAAVCGNRKLPQGVYLFLVPEKPAKIEPKPKPKKQKKEKDVFGGLP